MVYLISYEINERIADYTRLKETIKDLGVFQHPMDSLWFVDSPISSVDEIAERLQAAMPLQSEQFFIMKIDNINPQCQGWLPRPFWRWFKAFTRND